MAKKENSLAHTKWMCKYHIVFTPKYRRKIIYNQYKEDIRDILKQLCGYKGVEIMEGHLMPDHVHICVLHTWGSALNYNHPHLHTIILGGGLNEKNRWKDKGSKFFFPVKVMSVVFKRYYLEELKLLWKSDKLAFTVGATKLKNHYEFKELLNKLYDEDWVVYTKEAFNGAKSVIKYLGNYTHRSAISNKRIVAMDDATVTYMAKDYKKECAKYEPMTIAGTEFIRRFLMYVLPKGFVRIRYYGLLACRCKKDKMTLCRNLLGCEQYISRLRGKKVEEKMMILYNVDICKCKECGEPLRRFRVDGS